MVSNSRWTLKPSVLNSSGSLATIGAGAECAAAIPIWRAAAAAAFMSSFASAAVISCRPATKPITFATNPGDLLSDLAHQALDATNGHAQAATPLTPQQQQQIVEFETGLSTAQAIDFGA